MYYKFYVEGDENPLPLVVKESENANLKAERIDPTAHGVMPISTEEFKDLCDKLAKLD